MVQYKAEPITTTGHWILQCQQTLTEPGDTHSAIVFALHIKTDYKPSPTAAVIFTPVPL